MSAVSVAEAKIGRAEGEPGWAVCAAGSVTAADQGEGPTLALWADPWAEAGAGGDDGRKREEVRLEGVTADWLVVVVGEWMEEEEEEEGWEESGEVSGMGMVSGWAAAACSRSCCSARKASTVGTLFLP